MEMTMINQSVERQADFYEAIEAGLRRARTERSHAFMAFLFSRGRRSSAAPASKQTD